MSFLTVRIRLSVLLVPGVSTLTLSNVRLSAAMKGCFASKVTRILPVFLLWNIYLHFSSSAPELWDNECCLINKGRLLKLHIYEGTVQVFCCCATNVLSLSLSLCVSVSLYHRVSCLKLSTASQIERLRPKSSWSSWGTWCSTSRYLDNASRWRFLLSLLHHDRANPSFCCVIPKNHNDRGLCL